MDFVTSWPTKVYLSVFILFCLEIGSRQVAQAGFWTHNLPASAFQVLELETWCNIFSSVQFLVDSIGFNSEDFNALL